MLMGLVENIEVLRTCLNNKVSVYDKLRKNVCTYLFSSNVKKCNFIGYLNVWFYQSNEHDRQNIEINIQKNLEKNTK